MIDPRETAAQFSNNIVGRLGERVRSVLLYGSVARGEAIEKVSDINVLVLLDDVPVAVLREFGGVARRWVKAGNTAPLLLSWGEWQRAADAFAIELSDMIDAHQPLYGDDPLVGLRVERRALRLQAERELRGKLLQLREGMLLIGGGPEEMGRLLGTAYPSFLAYLRAALRLGGRPVPLESEQVISASEELLGQDLDAFRAIGKARREREVPRLGLESPVVASYYAAVERTADFVDNLPEVESS